MLQIDYSQAGVAVRSDLGVAHTRAWQRLAEAGAWWTGAERVALAAEVRNASRCAFCRESRGALSPFSVEGRHETDSGLSDAAVDAVHRIVTDPARLTQTWFDELQAEGLGEAAYVELVGVVVTVLSIDRFCRGIGVALHVLPEPHPGNPSHYRPSGLTRESAWVGMIGNGHLGPAESDLWKGRTGNVIRALSQVPDEVRTLQELSAACYLPLEQVMSGGSKRSLDRAQIEWIAARVSALNECFY